MPLNVFIDLMALSFRLSLFWARPVCARARRHAHNTLQLFSILFTTMI